MSGTAAEQKPTMPWQSTVKELNEQLTPRYQKYQPSKTINQTRDTFRVHQIPATIAMLDDESGDLALIATTENGWLIRIALTETQRLNLARALLTPSAGKPGF